MDWKAVELPDFSVSAPKAGLPSHLYEARCREAYARAGCDWLVVYGDREHYANLAFLTGFDPRFEEAILLLGAQEQRALLVGNEGMGYTSAAGLELEFILTQSLSLMGQQRERAPRLLDSLREAGVRQGQRVGLAGWKYLEPEEFSGEMPGFFAPALLVDALRSLAGDPRLVVEAAPVLMHPVTGLRARNEVEQIVAFEWEAARATACVWRILRGTRPGMSEFEAVAHMKYEGDPLSAHLMFATGKETIVGLRSPTSRRIERGDGATTAIGFWGGLGCRAGLVEDTNPEFLQKVALPYFRGIVAWYEAARIGISGGELFEKVTGALASGSLRPMLNPGHLTGLDEWVHSPVRPGSAERIASGMAFQCDIIPEPLPPGWVINCEDPVMFADQALRAELEQKYPEAWERIRRRQAFMRESLGIQVHDDILPLSSMPAYLPPLWLSPEKVLISR